MLPAVRMQVTEFGQRNARKPFGFGRFHRFVGLNEFLCPNYKATFPPRLGQKNRKFFSDASEGRLLSRRSRAVRLATERNPLWRRHVPGRDKGGPGLAGFRVVPGGSAGFIGERAGSIHVGSRHIGLCAYRPNERLNTVPSSEGPPLKVIPNRVLPDKIKP